MAATITPVEMLEADMIQMLHQLSTADEHAFLHLPYKLAAKVSSDLSDVEQMLQSIRETLKQATVQVRSANE